MIKFRFLFTIIFAITAGVLVAVIVMAWTNPTANPPSGNGAISYFNGNVGIGTAAPEGKLHVGGGGSVLVDDGVSGIGFYNRNYSGYEANHNVEFGFLGWGSMLAGMRTGTLDTNDTGHKIAFYTHAGAGAQERMRINKDGNVGIGTASPGYKLDVVGGSMRADGYVAGGQLCMGYASPDCRASWSAVGGSGFTGGGTTNYVPKWTSGTSLSNSTIFDDGTTVTVNSTYIRGATYGFGGMYVLNTPDGSCRRTNPYTGGCSCPAGFTPGWASDGADFHSWFCYK